MFTLASCFTGTEIDLIIPNFTVTVVNFIKIIVPVILVLFGMIDLAKAVIGNDEKVMKEAQSRLIKRVIYAVIIFFIVALVQFIFGSLAGASEKGDSSVDGNNISACITCFVSNPKACNAK